jgi:hypothetical protein
MIADIFSSKEIVRIFDFLLDNPLSQFTKSDIANGSSVSRPTVSKIVPFLVKIGVLERTRKFGMTELLELDVSSPLVVNLMKFDSELSKVFVNSNIDPLNSNASGYDALEIIHLQDRIRQYWHAGSVAETQLNNRQKVEETEELEIIINPIPSSA